MRTTITLEPDVLHKVKAEMKKHDLTFKQAVNKLLRSASTEEKKAPYNPFKGWARPLGMNPNLNWNSTSELLAQLDELEAAEKSNKAE